MSNYVLTLKLQTSRFHEDLINKRLEIARNIYNANVRELIKRDRKMRHDPIFKTIQSLKSTKEKSAVYKALKDKYEVSKYAMIRFTTPMNRHFSNNIPADVGHNQAIRAFQAYEKVRYSDGEKMRFKKFGTVNSIEGKSNTGIAYKKGYILFNPQKANVKCIIPVKFYKNDTYQEKALHDEIRYCRILKKSIKGRYQYFVQLIMEGTPPNHHIEDFSHNNKNTVGIDIGTSTVAVVSKETVILEVLSRHIKQKDKELKRLNRQLDRQRRANNPTKFDDHGRFIKNNDKWQSSKRYLRTKAKRQNVYRSIAEQRRISHQTLANKIVKLGCDVRVEAMRFKGLQAKAKATTINKKTGKFNKKKRFGKSLSLNAPALLISEIDKKLKYVNQSIHKVDTYTVKASQYDHIKDEYRKKALNERWNILDNEKVQRDLYSAFLIMNTDDTLSKINRNQCIDTYQNFKALHDSFLQNLKNNDIKHHCFA